LFVPVLDTVHNISTYFVISFYWVLKRGTIWWKEKILLTLVDVYLAQGDFGTPVTTVNTGTIIYYRPNAGSISVTGTATPATPTTSTTTKQTVGIPTRYVSPVALRGIIDVIAAIAKGCETDKATDSAQNPNQILPLIKLSEDQLDVLLGKIFLPKVIRDDCNIPATRDIVFHFSWENKEYSKTFTHMLLDGVLKVKWDSFRPFLKILSTLCRMRDSLYAWRVDLCLTNFVKMLEDNTNSKEGTEILAKYFFKQVEKNDEVKHWYSKNKSQIGVRPREDRERKNISFTRVL